MKNQFNNSFLKTSKNTTIGGLVRKYCPHTSFSVVFDLAYELVVESKVVKAFLNLNTEIAIHSIKVPPYKNWSTMQGADMGKEKYANEKKPPQRFDPLVLFLTSRRGRLLARFLSKGATLLHQGVYYDSCAPCETGVLSPSANRGWSV